MSGVSFKSVSYKPEEIMKVTEWLEALRVAKRSFDSAEKALNEIVGWIYQNVVGHDVLPRQFPPDLEAHFCVLHDALRVSRSSVAEIEESLDTALLDCLGGRRLTKEQFHLLMALNCLKFTNKSIGLSNFEDYEVFEKFCYEDGDGYSHYISPGVKPLSPPVVDGHTTIIEGRLGPDKAPEDIPWERLKPEQRSFFEKYLPEIAARFKRRA